MEFVFVGVGDQGLEKAVGGFDGGDGVRGEEGREALLPVVVTALDLALGLRGGSVRRLTP
jgi:hypothetical protein